MRIFLVFKILYLDMIKNFRKDKEEAYNYLKNEFNYLNEIMWNVISNIMAATKTISYIIMPILMVFLDVKFQIVSIIALGTLFFVKNKKNDLMINKECFHGIFCSNSLLILLNILILLICLTFKNIITIAFLLFIIIINKVFKNWIEYVISFAYVVSFIISFILFDYIILKNSLINSIIDALILILLILFIQKIMNVFMDKGLTNSLFEIKMKQILRVYMIKNSRCVFRILPCYLYITIGITFLLSLFAENEDILKIISIFMLCLFYYIELKKNVLKNQFVHLFSFSENERIKVDKISLFVVNFKAIIVNNIFNYLYFIICYCNVFGLNLKSIISSILISVSISMIATSSNLYIDSTEEQIRCEPQLIMNYFSFIEGMFFVLILGLCSILLETAMIYESKYEELEILLKLNVWDNVILIIGIVLLCAYIVKVSLHIILKKIEGRSICHKYDMTKECLK